MHKYLNGLSKEQCREALTRCCGSSQWVSKMLDARPYASDQELLEKNQTLWQSLDREDFLEAFSHHPQIGISMEALREKFQTTQAWSTTEQASVQKADQQTLASLAQLNQTYLAKYGYIFIVCATGKSATEMLSLLRERLENSPDLEIRIAAAEQEKITQLRLEKLST
ncbi:MAG: 2-oxo-4-hydroxy-4-carboxy-5-ureidoimidazoline decarboxylase [Myxococcota bacterium]|nr:2-oxo-4-hydroxy-4-carboxy-5-ureidoimidazoline decarboxylase [Myxococcota bacterium]